MTFKFEVKEIRFDFPLKVSTKRRILRKVGAKVATRIRKRFLASGKLRATGVLGKSIRFKLRKSGRLVIGYVTFRGTRPDGKRNFLLATIHANKGRIARDLLTSDDEAFFAGEVAREIGEALTQAHAKGKLDL